MTMGGIHDGAKTCFGVVFMIVPSLDSAKYGLFTHFFWQFMLIHVFHYKRVEESEDQNV